MDPALRRIADALHRVRDKRVKQELHSPNQILNLRDYNRSEIASSALALSFSAQALVLHSNSSMLKRGMKSKN
ncbi:hypothetical protein [Bradyrhizobium sp. Cp5.3]|uniref:Uncharacterized protein n=1 Tax=Bradyrhizobium neotropicale TaxID=1497615 RepID=A0A176ZCT3_9BRAD|nr:hypothetical protein [Bradyrhizobium sp. Cp5.3]OAF18004.1 hypothetical protein AXW67_05645 [Bradyrhizobium neotropicale]